MSGVRTLTGMILCAALALSGCGPRVGLDGDQITTSRSLDRLWRANTSPGATSLAIDRGLSTQR